MNAPKKVTRIPIVSVGPTFVKRATTAFLAILESIVEASIPFAANTSSLGLAAPNGLPLADDLGDPNWDVGPTDLGFSYKWEKEERCELDSQQFQIVIRLPGG